MNEELNEIDFERNLKFQRSLFAISASLGILIAYGLLSSLLLALTGFNEINPWVIGISEFAFLFIPTIIIIRPLKYKFSDIFIFKKINLKMLFIFIAGLILFEFMIEGYLSIQKFLLPVSWLKAYDSIISEYIQTVQKIIGKDNALILGRSILIVAIIPAISEEFLFRGFLQNTLLKNSQPYIAISISAVLFGAMHLNPVMFVPLALAGAYFGFTGYVSSNLFYPIIMHFLTNLISVISYFFQGNYSIDEMSNTVSVKYGLILFALGLAGCLIICYYLLRFKEKTKMNLPAED